jgi:hypothetical protein
VAQLEREKAHLERRLQQAETIIEVSIRIPKRGYAAARRDNRK